MDRPMDLDLPNVTSDNGSDTGDGHVDDTDENSDSDGSTDQDLEEISNEDLNRTFQEDMGWNMNMLTLLISMLCLIQSSKKSIQLEREGSFTSEILQGSPLHQINLHVFLWDHSPKNVHMTSVKHYPCWMKVTLLYHHFNYILETCKILSQFQPRWQKILQRHLSL